LGIADLLDAAIRLYQKSFGAFLGITAVVYVPAALLQVTAIFLIFGPSGLGGKLENLDKIEHLADLNWVALLPALGLFALALLIYALALPISQAALAVAVSRRYLGQPISIADAYQSVSGRWGEVIAASLLVGLTSGVGMLFCIAPGVYIGVMWMFGTAIIVLEGRSVMDSLRRSWDLVSGAWWRCFGTMVLLSIVIQTAAGLIAWPASIVSALLLMDKYPALGQAVNQSLGLVFGVLVQPVQVIGLVLLYYDLRVRKEAFDLELLARSLGATMPAPETPLRTMVPVPPPPPGTAPLPL